MKTYLLGRTAYPGNSWLLPLCYYHHQLIFLLKNAANLLIIIPHNLINWLHFAERIFFRFNWLPLFIKKDSSFLTFPEHQLSLKMRNKNILTIIMRFFHLSQSKSSQFSCFRNQNERRAISKCNQNCFKHTT